MTILVTGCAGFIGYHVCQALCAQGASVLGIDNLNSYYDIALKQARLTELEPNAHFQFHRVDVADKPALEQLFASHKITHVIHLAAQAGVRYSLTHPETYVDSNLVGFGNMLEACRQHAVEHLIYASSSSVYGGNEHYPFTETEQVDRPISLYAATKKANELMAYSYSHLYQLRATGLRFFTVYGPWGRPDMAYYKFTQNILAGQPIDVYNHGDMWRDFTYISDIVTGILAILQKPAPDDAHYKIYNIGRGEPLNLMDFIALIETQLERKAIKNVLPMQPGDVYKTYADTKALADDYDYQPHVTANDGVAQFIDWYKTFYKIDSGILT